MPIPLLRKKTSDSWRDYRESRGIKPNKSKKRKYENDSVNITLPLKNDNKNESINFFRS